MARLPIRITSIALLLIIQAAAVESGKPSRTSISSAARRALAAHDYDPTVRNPDWLAEVFLGPAEREMLAGDPVLANLGRDYREGIKEQGSYGRHLIRTRFIDERLQAALSRGVAQIVILGAGYDSRAYRMRELKGARVFEVDYGPTQEYKKQRVQEIFGCLPPHVSYVPIDFTREKLRDVLVKAGYQTGRVTFFIWEGVTYYIPEAAIRGTLGFVAAESAAGSSIVLDGTQASFIGWVKANLASPEAVPEVLRPNLAAEKKRVDWGEPWIFGFPDGREREFFKSVGLDTGELIPMDGSEAIRRYLTRRDGSIIFNVVPPVDARGAALPWPGGFVAELVVPKR